MDGSAEDTNGGRSLKRRRIEEENATQTSTSLPSEVLGNIMNFLDYKTVLSCAATSKSLLHAMSLITTLHIDKSSQLNALSSRYRDVTVINICSLLSMEEVEGDNPNTTLKVDNETVMKVVLFLSRFPKLKKVFLGGKDNDGLKFGVIELTGRRYALLQEERHFISNLMNQLSYAFQSNFLPSRLLVLGIRCPLCCVIDNNRGAPVGAAAGGEGNSSCPSCQLACKTWPLEHVIKFNNKGSSRWNKGIFEQRRPNTLDVCLTRDQIETIVKGRSGVEEMLCPERRLLHLLGNGRLHIIRSDDDGSPFYIVQFSQKDVDKLKEEVTKLNGKQLSQEDVTNAIMKSFSIDGAPTPPKSRCYLGRQSSRKINKIGLPVLNGTLVTNNINLPHIIKVVKVEEGPRLLEMQRDCLYLLNQILQQQGNVVAVQHVIDSELMPNIVNIHLNEKHMKIASAIIGYIVETGPATVIDSVIELGVIPKLVHLLVQNQNAGSNNDISAALFIMKSVELIAQRSTLLRDIVLTKELSLPLKTMMEKSENRTTDIPRLVASLICTLCRGDPKPDFELVRPYLSIISSILLVNNGRAESHCSKALLVLCALNEQRAIESTCTIMMELLANTSDVAKSNALKIIFYLIGRNETIFEHLMDSDMLSIIVPLLSSPKSVIQWPSSRIVCLLCKDHSSEVASSGCIPIFFGLLISSDKKIVKSGTLGLLRVS